jgi:hypothetical protein
MNARVIAVFYLIMTVLAPFGMMYVPSTLVVAGDAAATANNIMDSEALFRAGITSDALVVLIEIVLTVLLYMLLKPVNPTLSLIAAFSRLGMTIVQGINLLNHIVVLLLLSGEDYLKVFDPDQIHALALLFLNVHEQVTFVWGLFFGFHLLVLGYLVYRAGYLPKLLGVVLVVTACCYLVQSFGNILLPDYKETFAAVGYLAIIEIVFPVWLLVKGVKAHASDGLH